MILSFLKKHLYLALAFVFIAVGTASATYIPELGWVKFGNDIAYTEGNIGVGTTIPSEKIEVDGNVKAQGFILETLASDPVNPSEGQMWIVE